MELFIQPYAIEKEAYLHVGENPADWTKEVLETFYNQFPIFANSNVQVEWKKKEETKGYGIGAIKIAEGEGLIVPILIKAFELYPFDVAFVGGKIMPLTNATIQQYIQSKGAFLKLVPQETGDITTALYNTSFGQQIVPSYAAQVYKNASLIEKIGHTITQEMKDEIFEQLNSDKRLVETIVQNKVSEPFVKLSTVQSKKVDYRDAIRGKLTRDIHYLYKSGSCEWKLIVGNSRIVDPQTFVIDDTIAANIPKIKTATAPEITVEKAASAKAILPVINSDRRIALFEDGNFVDVPTEMKVAEQTALTINDEPVTKITGLFKVGEKVTSPFYVTAIVKENNRTIIEGFNGLEKVAYCPMKGIDEMYVENGVVYLPASVNFVKLGKQLDANVMEELPMITDNYIVNLGNGFYKLGGSAFEQYLGGSDKNSINQIDAIWHTIQCGGSESDVEKIASLREGNTYYIPRVLRVPKSFDKVAEAVEAEYTQYSNKIQELGLNLIKEAAGIPDVPTVDAALSLNFINKDNLAEFVEAIPIFQDVIFRLARMLFYTRLGVQIFNEQAIRKVMFGLIEVLSVLEGLSNLKMKSK